MEEFDWDEANIEKNWIKHQVYWKETEEVFLNQPILTFEDTKHAETEKRFIVLGKTNKKRLLHVVFTVRNKKIRVICARDQNRKERKTYESQTEKD